MMCNTCNLKIDPLLILWLIFEAWQLFNKIFWAETEAVKFKTYMYWRVLPVQQTQLYFLTTKDQILLS